VPRVTLVAAVLIGTVGAAASACHSNAEAQSLPRPTPVGERRDGGFVYRSDGSARVRAGGGGPAISLESFNGDVRVLRSAR